MNISDTNKRRLRLAAIPVVVQALVFELMVLMGTLYEQPLNTTTKIVQGVPETYQYYGAFGPYFTIHLHADLLLTVGIALSVLYLIASVGRARWRGI